MNKFQIYYKLRKLKLFRIVLKHFDFTVYVNLPHTNLKVAVKFFRNLAWVLKAEELEKELRNLICFIIKDLNPKIFWDLGSNIGYYSWLASDKVDEIVIFEPDRINLELINKTIRKNKLEDINVLDVAVSNKSGEELFLVDDVSSATGSLDRVNQIENKYSLQYNFHLTKRIKVKTKTLDDVLSAGYNAPDLIKIDVEGAEHLVLSGGRELIRSKNPIIILEGQYDNFKYLTKEYDYLIKNIDNRNLILYPQFLDSYFNNFKNILSNSY